MTETARTADTTIGEFVAEDYRTATVFERHGIDFCCGGGVSLSSVCRDRGLDCSAILREIEEAKVEPADRSQNYGAWELPFLAEYIVNTHHVYVRDSVESIAGYTRKIAEVHGGRHPELAQIRDMFARVATDIMAHLREEENTLFPAIGRINGARKSGQAPAAADVELIRNTLETLSRDHEEVGDAIHGIRDLTKNYAIPDDACNTYALTLRKLKEFEDDLHKHVHLENNILFPKAARL